MSINIRSLPSSEWQAAKGADCTVYLTQLRALIRDHDPLRDAVVNVCFDVRRELDHAYGIANRHTRLLVSHMHALHGCKNRSERIEVTLRITELIKMINDEYRRWPVLMPTMRDSVFQPSVLLRLAGVGLAADTSSEFPRDFVME